VATIQKRTLLFEKRKNNVIRFSDWALVTTPLGVCAEPFNFLHNRNIGEVQAFDSTDEMSRIDDMQSIDMDKEKVILSGGVGVVTGGNLMPRVGR